MMHALTRLFSELGYKEIRINVALKIGLHYDFGPNGDLIRLAGFTETLNIQIRLLPIWN
ncbi:hypothetical protein SAMN06272722_1165 [Paenibacillus sp. RU5A]|nr:hypothetical protein SAMN06272722_1165 [Paenibacillus sp. RU5A]SOC76157.1 hypothetical protein SAMN05880581_1165 [Paenibacillus sp. RU26A]SOC77812.1 hypothetical protein SAMN05880586_1165 [Paenibacillus sp. RU5M]